MKLDLLKSEVMTGADSWPLSLRRPQQMIGLDRLHDKLCPCVPTRHIIKVNLNIYIRHLLYMGAGRAAAP